MIVLFTDFGPSGPYTGQMEAVLKQMAPEAPVIHLLQDAPRGSPRLSSYLLAALRHSFPQGTVFLAVVDPGVGGERMPVVLQADGQFFVGPGNGLMNTVAVQSKQTTWHEIVWRPDDCSCTIGQKLYVNATRSPNKSIDMPVKADCCPLPVCLL